MPATLPVDIVNRALDECGVDEIGDLEDGSDVARAALRVYWPTVRQLLSAVHWNFARRQEPMVLIGDISGVSNAYTNVPSPWIYMYEWPTDCVHARFVPRTMPGSSVGGTPIFSSTPNVTVVGFNSPAPFLVASSDTPNDVATNWYLIEGHDPEQTRVILTNQLGASLVYTGLMQYPDAWDPLFEQAVVSSLAARLAMPCIKDKKFARQVRSDNIMIAKSAIDAARVRDGDEGWTIQDTMPDWIRARDSGCFSSGPGVLFYPYSSVPWLDGGAF